MVCEHMDLTKIKAIKSKRKVLKYIYIQIKVIKERKLKIH